MIENKGDRMNEDSFLYRPVCMSLCGNRRHATLGVPKDVQMLFYKPITTL